MQRRLGQKSTLSSNSRSWSETLVRLLYFVIAALDPASPPLPHENMWMWNVTSKSTPLHACCQVTQFRDRSVQPSTNRMTPTKQSKSM